MEMKRLIATTLIAALAFGFSPRAVHAWNEPGHMVVAAIAYRELQRTNDLLPLGAGRDWEAEPAVVLVDHAPTIYALGDVHGDYGRLVDLLTAGGLIAERPEKPDQVKWSGGKAVLVCTGDLIDKGDHALHVIALFQALQTEAAKDGGRVIVTMGNHEAEFLADPENDVKAAEFVMELKAKGIAPSNVAAGKDPLGIGVFLRSLPFAARVDDWFFAHAGHTHGLTLKELDTALRHGVDQDGYGTKILSNRDSLLEAKLHDPAPWWEQKGDSPEESRDRLSRAVEVLGAKHLVIGHQPGHVDFSNNKTRKKGKMFQNYDGLIFLIDVGMSRAPNLDLSKGALLRIETSEPPRATIVHHDGVIEPLWPEP